jgi:hypothetical protein
VQCAASPLVLPSLLLNFSVLLGSTQTARLPLTVLFFVFVAADKDMKR